MKLRSVNTDFWEDDYISDLSPLQRYFYLYLITNPKCNLIGMYEISITRMSYDTGFSKDEVRIHLERFEEDGKLVFENGYILLRNFLKNQSLFGKMLIAVKNLLSALPEKIRSTEFFELIIEDLIVNEILSNECKSFIINNKANHILPNDIQTDLNTIQINSNGIESYSNDDKCNSNDIQTDSNGIQTTQLRSMKYEDRSKKIEEGREEEKEKEKIKKKEKEIPAIAGASPPKNYIDNLLEVFCAEYEKSRGFPFELIDSGKEKRYIGKIANIFKQKFPEMPTDIAKGEITNFFKDCLKIPDKWHYESMSPTHIATQYNQIISIINRSKNGKQNGTSGFNRDEMRKFVKEIAETGN
ncbi:MAG: hypothetical protein KIT33_15090 [Candidatus Kapabacteria bacterium]|nr:hypothetical protein [Ignavibacteriota bacterium]MCW5886295.1 hypothetical protein [Candidatus Kapabacteria bacterium]